MHKQDFENTKCTFTLQALVLNLNFVDISLRSILLLFAFSFFNCGQYNFFYVNRVTVKDTTDRMCFIFFFGV